MIFHIYISGTIIYAIFLAIYFIKDKDTAKTDLTSWIIFLIACIIWPISIPVSYYEKQRKMGNILDIKFLIHTEKS